MDMLKKRERKTLSKTKMNTKDGTVDFTGTDKAKKGQRKVGEKKAFKFSGKKSPFKKFKKDGDAEGENSGKPEAETGAGQSNSQIRRQKKKVSDLIKKLRLNYNKLLMKKKELNEGSQKKSELVQECMDLLTDEKYGQLVFKHDGCRILQAMVKHGSMDQKKVVITKLKPFFI